MMKIICRAVVFVLITCIASGLQAADYYVARSGSNTHTPPYMDWGSAASNLQTAVDVANAGDTVWVGPGTYGASDDSTVNTITNVVKLYNKSLTLRSSAGRETTIIDGEGKNRCVWMGAGAASQYYTLDGFTVTNGYANGSTLGSSGVYIWDGGSYNGYTVTVKNCTIAGNFVADDNTDWQTCAGGIFFSGAYDINQSYDHTISNCIIRGNWTNGIHHITYSTNLNSQVTIADCLIEDNVGVGAILSGGTVLTTVKDCIIRRNDNYKGYGAGMNIGRKGVVKNCLIYRNRHLVPYSANNYAGASGMYISGASTNLLINCTIVSNICHSALGDYSGGKTLYMYRTVKLLRILNTIVVSNYCDVYGYSDTPTDTSTDHYLDGSQGAIISWTNCLRPGTTGSGNLNGAPEFWDLNSDPRLRPWSIGVDDGLVEPWMLDATDVAGNPRISNNGLVDIGAHETTGESRPIHYVAQNGQAQVAPYTNLIYAASNIQDAIAWADNAHREIVEVSPGRYTLPPSPVEYAGTNIVYIDKEMTLRSSTDNPADVVLDGEGKYRGLAVLYNGDGKIVVDGLTITNCMAQTGGGGMLLQDPRSYTTLGWTGVVQNCVINGNTVMYGPDAGYMTEGAIGGGIAVYNRSAANITISNCVLHSNLATNELAPLNIGGLGGGLYSFIYSAFSGQITVKDCVLETNAAYRGGNAFISGKKTVENCVIANGKQRPLDNGTQSFGGGIFDSGGYALYKGCLMYGNDSYGGRGGAINFEGRGSNAFFEIHNCTFADNMRAVYLREIGTAQGGNPQLYVYNSILYSNGVGVNGDFYVAAAEDGRTHAASNSCYYPTNPANIPWDSTSISNYPSFKDPAGQNYRLNRDSLCINAGMILAGMENELDLDDKPRLDVRTGIPDMGCYEYFYQGSTIVIR